MKDDIIGISDLFSVRVANNCSSHIKVAEQRMVVLYSQWLIKNLSGAAAVLQSKEVPDDACTPIKANGSDLSHLSVSPLTILGSAY